MSGAKVTRPRVGFRPTNPQQDAGEGAAWHALSRPGAGAFEIGEHHEIEGWIDGLGAGNRRLDELDRVNLPAPYELAKPQRIEPHILGILHRRALAFSRGK